MTKVISFISRKGGTGKTTNAIHLATTIHQNGHRVLLIETDPNFTLSTLRKMELFKLKDQNPLFEINGSDDSRVADEIATLRANQGYDFILVDSAGKTTDEAIKKLCLQSDLVVVPTSLTQNDLLVTYQTVVDLAPARNLNSRLKIVVLPNRIHGATNLHTVRETLKNLDALILPAIVPQKNLFVNFSTLTASKEYESVAQAILNYLK